MIDHRPNAIIADYCAEFLVVVSLIFENSRHFVGISFDERRGDLRILLSGRRSGSRHDLLAIKYERRSDYFDG